MKKILKYMSFHAAKKNNIISNTCFSQEELNNAKNIILELPPKKNSTTNRKRLRTVSRCNI